MVVVFAFRECHFYVERDSLRQNYTPRLRSSVGKQGTFFDLAAVNIALLHLFIQRAHRLARLSAITRIFEPLPVDSSVAASYAEIAAATYKVKRKSSARSLDLMIAATAHAQCARLVTANIRDVKHLDHILEIIEVK